jgi:hypothetical protein
LFSNFHDSHQFKKKKKTHTHPKYLFERLDLLARIAQRRRHCLASRSDLRHLGFQLRGLRVQRGSLERGREKEMGAKINMGRAKKTSNEQYDR